MYTHQADTGPNRVPESYAANQPFVDEGDEGIDLREYLRVLNRHKAIIAAVFILVFVGACLYLFQVTPLYTAQVQLTLDMRKLNVTKVEDVVSGLSTESSVVGTEMDILRSSSLVGRVVDKLHLTQDPLFNPSLNPDQKPGLFDAIIGWFKSLWQVNPEEVPSPDEFEKRLRLSIVNKLQGGLTVAQRKMTNTISVSYIAPDPKRAAQITNTFADIYLADQLEAKFDATRQAHEWLANRLQTLQAEVQSAEQAVKKVREAGKIIQGKGGTLLEQQLGDINGQLVAAQVKVSQAEARLRGARETIGRSGGIESLGEVLNSSVIHSLRASESELRRKMAELSQRYGNKHPQVIQTEAELKDVRSKLQEEANRIVQNLENEVKVARAGEITLQRSLVDLQAQAGKTMDTELQLRELERQAESSRTLYQGFLSRFQETKEQENLQRPDARIISAAEVPGVPSSPKRFRTITLGAVLGLFFGVLAAFLVESMDRGFRTNEQVEKSTGVPILGMVPLLNASEGSPIDYVVDKPFSSFSESLRSIRNALHLAHVDRPPKTVMVTSSLPGEGKSSLCALLGRITALAGVKTLLIDADLRRTSIVGLFPDIKIEMKLEDLLQNDLPLQQAIGQDAASGLYVLGAHGNTPLAAELLGSKRMQKLMHQAEQEFDLILLDTPPVLGISDAWAIAARADALLYLVQWSETPREIVQAGLRQLQVIGVHPSGMVLSMVNMSQQKKYGYGGYGCYSDKIQSYYHD